MVPITLRIAGESDLVVQLAAAAAGAIVVVDHGERVDLELKPGQRLLWGGLGRLGRWKQGREYRGREGQGEAQSLKQRGGREVGQLHRSFSFCVRVGCVHQGLLAACATPCEAGGSRW